MLHIVLMPCLYASLFLFLTKAKPSVHTLLNVKLNIVYKGFPTCKLLFYFVLLV